MCLHVSANCSCWDLKQYCNGLSPSRIGCLQIDNMEDYVNQHLAVKIIEVEMDKQRVVFSARKASNDKQLEEYNVSHQLGH